MSCRLAFVASVNRLHFCILFTVQGLTGGSCSGHSYVSHSIPSSAAAYSEPGTPLYVLCCQRQAPLPIASSASRLIWLLLSLHASFVFKLLLLLLPPHFIYFFFGCFFIILIKFTGIFPACNVHSQLLSPRR